VEKWLLNLQFKLTGKKKQQHREKQKFVVAKQRIFENLNLLSVDASLQVVPYLSESVISF
jgi:hypothetical protein